MQKKALFTTLFVILTVSVVAYGFILYGKGYRLNLHGDGNKILAGTGLLVLTSTPNGAKVHAHLHVNFISFVLAFASHAVA